MKTANFFIVTLIIIGFAAGCKKGNDTEPPIDPVVIIKPDTIPTGWTKIVVDTAKQPINDIFFINNSLGYAGSSRTGILKSTDGGIHWNNVSSYRASNIAITNDGKAFFVQGNYSVFLKTIDGGISFTESNINTPILSDVFFSDNTTGMLASISNISITTNSGIDWTPVVSFPNLKSSYTTAFMYDNNNAWVVYSNKIVHANGNLNSWQTDTLIAQPGPNFGLVSVWATSPTTVFASSYSGYLYKSTNGGASFAFTQKLNYGAINNFSDIHFINANTGFISVGSRIYKTTDGGANWQMILALGNTSILEIHFTDENHGWACCADGTILKLN
ncbi:MAG: YCF48-related protein [Ferruginibacter sp.]